MTKTEINNNPTSWSEIFSNRFNELSKQIEELDSRICKLETMQSDMNTEAIAREYCERRCLVMIPRETLIRLFEM